MHPAEALIRFELKYCERCGGLWLRPCATPAVYCSRCARQMAELARHCLPRPDLGAAATATCLLVACQPWLDLAGGWCA